MKTAVDKGIKQGIEQGLKLGLQQGIQQGIKQGIEQEKLNIARQMKSEGMPIASIARYTGLPEEDLGNL